MPPLVVPSLAPFWSSPSRSITRIPHFHEETSLPSTNARPHHKRLAEGKTKNQGGAGWAVKLSPHGELGLARGYPELLVNDHWSTSPSTRDVKRRRTIIPGVIDVPHARPSPELIVDECLEQIPDFVFVRDHVWISEQSFVKQWIISSILVRRGMSR